MKPKTRLDNFLAKIAKDPEADTSMEPKSRKEYYLNEIAENGGSGSGGGTLVLTTNMVGETQTLDRTFSEIQEAASSGCICVLAYNMATATGAVEMEYDYMIKLVHVESANLYGVTFYRAEANRALEFEASSPSAYPTLAS